MGLLPLSVLLRMLVLFPIMPVDVVYHQSVILIPEIALVSQDMQALIVPILPQVLLLLRARLQPSSLLFSLMQAP